MYMYALSTCSALPWTWFPNTDKLTVGPWNLLHRYPVCENLAQLRRALHYTVRTSTIIPSSALNVKAWDTLHCLEPPAFFPTWMTFVNLLSSPLDNFCQLVITKHGIVQNHMVNWGLSLASCCDTSFEQSNQVDVHVLPHFGGSSAMLDNYASLSILFWEFGCRWDWALIGSVQQKHAFVPRLLHLRNVGKQGQLQYWATMTSAFNKWRRLQKPSLFFLHAHDGRVVVKVHTCQSPTQFKELDEEIYPMTHTSLERLNQSQEPAAQAGRANMLICFLWKEYTESNCSRTFQPKVAHGKS